MSGARTTFGIYRLARMQIRNNNKLTSFKCEINSPRTLFTSTSGNGSTRNGNGRAGRQREIGETTILVQEGLNIQEVPVAVLKSDPCKVENEKSPPKPYLNLDPKEEKAFVDGFSNFNSPREVLRMLDTIPSQEVTPKVSLSILKKLFELENNFGFRNEGKSWVIAGDNASLETFARTAIVSRLIDTIISSDDGDVLVDTLEVLRSEKRPTTTDSSLPWFGQFGTPFPESLEDFSSYSNRLCNEVLVRTSEGRLRLETVCRAICTLGEMDRSCPHNFHKRFIDKMWAGILSKSGDISAGNIVKVFATIPYFTKSRRLVLNLVERKMLTLCWNLDIRAVAEICEILVENERRAKLCWRLSEFESLSSRFMVCLSRCASLNLHLVTEEQLSQIVRGFLAMDYFDANIEKVLNKYVKAKSRKIVDSNLIAVIMGFVQHFRLRTSANIMEGAADYFVQHGPELTSSQIHSIVMPFGLLDFQPPNGVKFWEMMESILNEKFVQFSPTDFIDVLLACVYLKKYPLNFVHRVFSPYFLDRLHTSERDFNTLQRTRSRLKLLDTALSLECPAKFSGPVLPRDFTAKSIYIDNRIHKGRRILEKFLPLPILFPETDFTIETDLPLPNMPLNELYIIDFIITPKVSSTTLPSLKDNSEAEEERDEEKPEASFLPSLSLRNRINLKYSRRGGLQCQDVIALLINIPEHFSADGEHLTGPQVMRVRHLRALGFQVFTFKFEKLMELHLSPRALVDYLKESFSSVREITP